MFDRIFKLTENHTDLRTELLAGLTTFLTMAYIIFLQPMVLSGRLSETDTGMDFGSVTTATCLAAALATLLMGIYARYPIAQTPGMGENFVFVGSLLPGAGGRRFDDDAQRDQSRLVELRRIDAHVPDYHRHPHDLLGQRRPGLGVHRLPDHQAIRRAGPRCEVADVRHRDRSDRLFRLCPHGGRLAQVCQ